ncbi:MAG: cytochrome d ubiquinol oxidase subunit II [Candidatus Limnocylindrales bacterium]|jgi:cytochrome d ubiquinol oxidase subunit II
MQLSTVWFLLIGFLLTGYAILDGFDLGVGALHMIVARTDSERRQVLNSIGPVWDGNEVWLITGGGALFAAFPNAYATVFSGFYLAMVLLLGALILRATSIEFRSMETNRFWRLGWDFGFSLGSVVAAILFGVALGNVLRGIPIDADGGYRGGLVGLLNPFALSIGVMTLGLALLQGSAWLVMKTEGAIQTRARRTGIAALVLIVLAWIGATGLALGDAKRVFDNFGNVLTWVVPFLTANALLLLVLAWRARQDGRAFLFSSLAVVGMAVTAGIALYPDLVPAVDAVRSVTIDNAHSSDTALTIMLMVALIGMPIVIGYTSFIYWKFKGKVRLDEASY